MQALSDAERIIVCTSVHHHNTRRVAEAMASVIGGRVLDPGEEALVAARDGALLGLGSGIFFGSHHTQLVTFARSLPQTPDAAVFLFSTSGTGYRLPRIVGRDYHRTLRQVLLDKGYAIAGEFSCKGYDTYGVFGKLGGVARGRPNAADLADAGAFARQVAANRQPR